MTSERGVTPDVDRFSVPPDKLSGLSVPAYECSPVTANFSSLLSSDSSSRNNGAIT